MEFVARETYESRYAAAARALGQWHERQQRYTLATLCLGAGVVLVLVPIVRSGGSLALLLSVLAALAVCAVLLLHARRQTVRMGRVTAFYEQGLDRISGKKLQTGHTGDMFVEAGHVYARDLNVVGANSLFGMLATTRTVLGQRALARCLLRGVSAAEARARQEAVQELTPAFDLRERVALLGGSSFELLPEDSFERWLAGGAAVLPQWLRPALLLLTAAWLAVLLGGLLLHADEAALWRNVVALLALQGALCLRYRAAVREELDAAERLAGQARILRDGLALLRVSTFCGPLLHELQVQAGNDDRALRALQGLLRLVDQHAKEWYYVPALSLAVGTQAAVGLQRWKRLHAGSMRAFLQSWSEFDALLALSTYAVEHPENVYPEVLQDEAAGEIVGAEFVAEDMRHPLLPPAEAVANDVRLNAGTRFLLISGSNMAGKSTLLRAMGLHTVMSLAGLPVPARTLRLHALHVGASLALSDSLAERKSKFLSEVERLKLIVALAQQHCGRVLFLVDEIFSGTNSLDRKAAAEAVLHSLTEAAAIGALSTHDLTLTALAEQPQLHGINVHMASAREDDPLAFDYKLKPGANETTNALAIVRMLGL